MVLAWSRSATYEYMSHSLSESSWSTAFHSRPQNSWMCVCVCVCVCACARARVHACVCAGTQVSNSCASRTSARARACTRAHARACTRVCVPGGDGCGCLSV